MGNILTFINHQEPKRNTPKNMSVVGTKVTQLTTRGLPIDLKKLSELGNGSEIFFIKLRQEGVVNIALDEEELDNDSTLHVLGEDDESWDLTLGEFIEVMLEKPASTNHEDLKSYITEILGRVKVEVVFDAYSPNVEEIMILDIDEDNLSKLMMKEIVTRGEEGFYYFSIRTDLNSESIATYPEEFRLPTTIPLSFMLIHYFMGTFQDNRIHYSSDTSMEILHFHNGTMHMIPTTYGRIYKHILNMIYEKIPHYRKFDNGNIAIQLFHKTQVISHLR